MTNKVAVEVTEAGDGKVYMASDLKALPPAQAGTVIEVKAGPYAEGLVERELVVYAASAEPEVEEDTAVTDDLTKIDGLGKASAAKLAEAEVTTFAALAEADTAELSEATGIATNKIEEWQAAVRELAADEEPAEEGE